MPISTLVCTLLAFSGPALEIQVDGAGLLRFARTGRAVYAKRAAFSVTSGHLTSGGCDLLPAITVPNDAVSIDVDLEGNLYAVRLAGRAKIGKLVLAMFPSEEALSADGKFLIAKDRPSLGEAGQDLFGVVRKVQKDSSPSLDGEETRQGRAPGTEQVRTIPDSRTLPKLPPIQGQPAVRVTTQIPQKTKSPVAPYRASQSIKASLPVITIRPDNQAKGDKILLGEIADVAADGKQKELLESAPIGDTPAIGVVRGLDAVTITSSLARAGWKLGTYALNMTPGAKVRRECQQITDDKFVAAAIDAAKGTLKILAPMHSDVIQPPISLPLGEVSLKVENINKAGLGATASIGIYVDGRRINSRIVQLSPDRDAVGISPNQRVKVLVRAAGATVEVSGKAKEQGWAGQQISVETDTGAVLTGTVTPEGTVEVSL